jgi:Stress responsive A/B Barrel Domain
MVKHIVIWKLKASAEGATKEQNAAKIKSTIEALKTKIPQIKHIEVGSNIVPSDAAYDVALYAEFVSLQDLDIYQKHSEHLAAAGFINKVVDGRVVVDYSAA